MFDKLRGLFGRREDKSSPAPGQSTQAPVEIEIHDGFSPQLSAVIERSSAASLKSGLAVESAQRSHFGDDYRMGIDIRKATVAVAKAGAKKPQLELPVYIAGTELCTTPENSDLCGRGRIKCWVYHRSLSGLSLQTKFSKSVVAAMG